ncbi:MAG: FecR domain-containing protein [Verrucomicrobiota bacterium JB022]|nr:FecR domain-containing protein [Verrucomicrobiota bacterium JB022]
MCVGVAAQTPITRILLGGVSGEVTVFKADGSQAAGRSGMLLQGSDRVRTGTTATGVLLFSNGIRVQLQPDSELVIEQFTRSSAAPPPASTSQEEGRSETRLRLNYGQVVGQVDKLREDSSFEVVTPVGIAGIRGTQFVVTLTRNGDGTFTASLGVKEGLVEFRLAGAGAAAAATLVGANQQVQVSGEVGANGEVRILNFSGLQGLTPEALQRIEAGVAVIVQQIRGAQGTRTNPTAPPPPPEPQVYTERGSGSISRPSSANQ